MSKRGESPYQLTINGKTFDLVEDVYELLLATSKERDTLRGNYESLERDYDTVNERALDTAMSLAEVDSEFAEAFRKDEFWKIVVSQVKEKHRASHNSDRAWS